MDHLNAHKHVLAKAVPNVIGRCLISFLMGYDRNDGNDKGNGKSYMRKIGRGLQISCHSCHLCHWRCMDDGLSEPKNCPIFNLE